MFENSFFSKFKEATSGEINLEEDLENVVATFGTVSMHSRTRFLPTGMWKQVFMNYTL